jgi:hypothetical protein
MAFITAIVVAWAAMDSNWSDLSVRKACVWR